MARVKLELPEDYLWETEIGVRITDVNYGGHLGNDALLSLLHEARARFFRSHGYGELNVEGPGIVVADAVVVYRAEAFFADRLKIRLAVADFNKYGFDFLYRVEAVEGGREIARAKTGIVFFDYTERKLAPAPAAFLDRLRMP